MAKKFNSTDKKGWGQIIFVLSLIISFLSYFNPPLQAQGTNAQLTFEDSVALQNFAMELQQIGLFDSDYISKKIIKRNQLPKWEA